MSISNEEEFKLEQNHKIYSVLMSIQEDQLGLALISFSHKPKKFSGFFSLNELRISSKIFEHTKTLFEAKEIIKRTVIKKQLMIDEDEFRARITFDTGLGHDSVPFPIILFRDSDDKGPRISTIFDNKKDKIENGMKDPSDNLKKSFINKAALPYNNGINFNFPQNNNNANNTILRASIGNNVNNKMLNNIPNNNKIQFNNSMKVLTSSKIFPNNNINININNNNQNGINFKEVDLRNDNNKDKYLNYNKNIFYNIYNNVNNNNNINSSFYKDLNKSFSNENPNLLLVNNTNNIPPIRKGIRNIDNNMSESNIIPVTNNNINANINTNNNIIKKPNNINNNVNNLPIQYINQTSIDRTVFQNNNNNNYPQDSQDIPVTIPKPIINQNQITTQKQIINKNNITNNQSFHTAPIQRNVVLIPNSDPKINKNILFNNNIRKTYNFQKENNNMRLSVSEDSEENDDGSLDEYNKDGNQPYRFKNLLIHGSKKVKGNLEKFQKNQNIGNYLPTGTKFVSYLKFPDTKKNISNNSLTLSTISSSITSGSNRAIGIEKNIIKHPGELDEISSRIQRTLNKKNIKYKIIFRSNIDGDCASTFHEKCDKIRNTLILIKASGNKRFGGFTTETWDGNDINKKDEKSFIFSIDKMKIYDIIPGQNAINCNPDLGPVFLGQIKLLDKFFTQGGTTSTKGKNYKTLEDFEITDGAEKFGVQEVEVYQIK